jgi:hypothetical protein
MHAYQIICGGRSPANAHQVRRRFLSDEAFHSRDNMFVLQTFAAIAGFDLANELFVVTRQPLDRFMHQRFAVASAARQCGQA